MAGRFTRGTAITTAVVIAGVAGIFLYQSMNGGPRVAPPPAPGTPAGPVHVTGTEPFQPWRSASAVRLDPAAGFKDPDGGLGRRLTDEQRKAFEAAIVLKTYDQAPPAVVCKGDRHVFQYQDGRGHAQGDATVCACGGVTMDPDNRFPNAWSEYVVDTAAVKTLLEGLGAPTAEACAAA